MKYLDTIEARVKASTPGPWVADKAPMKRAVRVEHPETGDMELVCNSAFAPDANFIAHARVDIEVLLRVVRAAQEVSTHRVAMEIAGPHGRELIKALAVLNAEVEGGVPEFCSQEGCTTPAVLKVSWPGRGWVHYCYAHGNQAIAILDTLGAAGAVERISMDEE